MKRVLWVSRHQMTEDQNADLVRALGDRVELIPWRDTVRSAQELLPAMETADAVAVVLPPDLTAEVLRLAGEKPVLRAVSGREATGRTRTLADGRQEEEFLFVHQGWEQILRVEIVTRRL